MTTLTLPPAPTHALLLPHSDRTAAPAARQQKRRLLVMTDDEAFWQTLFAAASKGSREVIRDHATAEAPRTLYLAKPAVVLLDLDLPSAAGWDAADSLLQEASSPPLLLLTSQGDQADFKTAIQAGSLIDKSECPTRLLELAEVTLELPGSVQREQSATQRLVIRWLKPCNWSAQVIPLRRFWGINE